MGLEHTAPAPPSQSSVIVEWKPAQDSPRTPVIQPAAAVHTEPSKTGPFRLPEGLPGADAAPIQVPSLKDLSATEREKKVREAFPELPPLPVDQPPAIPESGKPLALADLQEIALTKSPVIKRAEAEADSAYGLMIQAGLYPNPNIGWQADQMQPGNKRTNNAGQQGAFIQQLIKTAGKLSLARAAAGMDFANAQVAARRARLDVLTQVRYGYFAVLVTRETMQVSRTMTELAEEVYRLQLRLVASGEAAAYEPLQLYAQAAQARTLWIQAKNRNQAAWRQLGAALGEPDLPMQSLAGTADAPPPAFEADEARARVLESHTDILSAQNSIMQANLQLRLAQRTPIPDITTGTAVQHDNSNGNNQVNLQIGFALPIYDRNQGNIRSAQALLARAGEDLRAKRNDLSSRLAEAQARASNSRVIVMNYRERVLPNLSRAYRGIYQRYQQEPDKVSFNDIVVAQQNLGQSLSAYLTALSEQWTAIVDVANLLQIDELYQPLPEVLPKG